MGGEARDVGVDSCSSGDSQDSQRERKIVGSAQNSGGMIASGGQPEERKWPESKHVELQGWLRTSR